MNNLIRIGVDVGGTNTDAALLRGADVLATIKSPTSEDVTTGVSDAVKKVLKAGQMSATQVGAVMVGTTHFLNAVVEGKHLEKVGILRLCGAATRALPPLIDWPNRLRPLVDGGAVLVDGGVNFDGSPIATLDENAIRTACQGWRENAIKTIAICGVFALVDARMEQRAADIICEEMPEAAISLSHRIGRNGFLRRENATILNASLANLGRKTITAFNQAFTSLGITCPLYLTQNDGTLMTADFAQNFPVLTIASGPTNSMRGAAFITGLKDAAVIDIGGTTTDIGMLVGGFPRVRSEGASIGEVTTNFRVPDVLSIGLGGGSLVRLDDEFSIGPDSVGYKLLQKSICSGGKVLTATDIAVAAGIAKLGDARRLQHLKPSEVRQALMVMKSNIEAALDKMKPSSQPIPAILVGGGSVLIEGSLEGTSECLRPHHFGSANAIGAAIAQVSGNIDRVVTLEDTTRESAIDAIIKQAHQRAIEAGAEAASIKLVELDETPLAYLPGNAVQIAVKVVGDLKA